MFSQAGRTRGSGQTNEDPKSPRPGKGVQGWLLAIHGGNPTSKLPLERSWGCALGYWRRGKKGRKKVRKLRILPGRKAAA